MGSEFKYPARDKMVEERKAAVVKAFQGRQAAREKAAHLSRKAGVPVTPWNDLTWERLADIESGDPAVVETLLKDENFKARQAELHRERNELEAALELAEQGAVIAWIVGMPLHERKRRERETWTLTQLARFGAEDERDLQRRNPEFFEKVYLPQRDRMLAAEQAAEQGAKLETVNAT